MPDRSLLNDALNFLYAKVAGNLSISAAEGGGEADIDRWIRLASRQAGAAGFMTNLGGVLALPVAIPANLAGTAAVQLRLIAKIAAARGYDTQSEEVKTFVFACLLGNAATDVLKGAGVRIGTRVGLRVGPAVLQKLNRSVLARLVARFGTQGVVSLTKVVPIMGGLIGGGLDAASTRVVGTMAKRVFVPKAAPAPTLEKPQGEPPLLLVGPPTEAG